MASRRCALWRRIGCCSSPHSWGNHDLTEQCRRGDRLDRIRLRPIPRSSWSAPGRPADDSFFWLYHVSSFYVDTRSRATTALVLSIFLLPQLRSRLITGWLYNSAGSSVLIAGLFHSMHNAIVNSTGLVAVVDLPQFEVGDHGRDCSAGWGDHRRRHSRPPRTQPTRTKCRSK
jgi:hypothetical protein